MEGVQFMGNTFWHILTEEWTWINNFIAAGYAVECNKYVNRGSDLKVSALPQINKRLPLMCFLATLTLGDFFSQLD